MFSQSDPCFDILCKGIKTSFPPIPTGCYYNHFMQIWLHAYSKVINVLEELNKKDYFCLCKTSAGAVQVIFMVQLATDPS